MRSLSADAAIVAVPSLGATAGAIWATEHLFRAAAERGPGLSPELLFPTMAMLAFALTWAAYFIVVGLLAYRALSTSNALVLFLTLVSLLVVLVLLNRPEFSVSILVASAGTALALRLLRRKSRRPIRPQ
jgi:hypothetical protein